MISTSHIDVPKKHAEVGVYEVSAYMLSSRDISVPKQRVRQQGYIMCWIIAFMNDSFDTLKVMCYFADKGAQLHNKHKGITRSLLLSPTDEVSFYDAY